MAAAELTRRLIAQGHRKIEFVSYDTTLRHIHEREEGYRTEMEENGLAENCRIHKPEIEITEV